MATDRRTRFTSPLLLISALGCFTLMAMSVACRGGESPRFGSIQDEALRAGRHADSFAAADEDYFHAMDRGVALTPDEVKGRNNWIVWTGGNDRFWDYLSNHSYGVFDLLKTVSSETGSHPFRSAWRPNSMRRVVST